jgi:hypothetical protein
MGELQISAERGRNHGIDRAHGIRQKIRKPENQHHANGSAALQINRGVTHRLMVTASKSGTPNSVVGAEFRVLTSKPLYYIG